MPGGTDAGQIGIGDTTTDYNITSFVVRQMLGRMSTMKLGKIIAVHLPDNGPPGQVKVGGTVDVQLLTNQLDGEGKSTPHGIVYGMPYVRHQGGTNAHINDPLVGDIGLMHVSDRDLSANIKARGAANPGSSRRFSPSDSIWLGGILNAVPQQYQTFLHDMSHPPKAIGILHHDANNNEHRMDQSGVVHTDAVNNNVISMLSGGISHISNKANIVQTALKAITHTAGTSITHTAANDHTINASTHPINAITNVSKLLKVSSVAQATNFITGTNGGTGNLSALKNFIHA
jgi:hypothetical protein